MLTFGPLFYGDNDNAEIPFILGQSVIDDIILLVTFK
jgi:hypothetical protein